MSAHKLEETLEHIEDTMKVLAPQRKAVLFRKFLIRGYSAITLDTVKDDRFEDLLTAKLCLGSLITLYDDFADRPDLANPRLLEILYQLNFENYYSNIKVISKENDVILLAEFLFEKIYSTIHKLPNYDILKEVMNFDLSQFYSANQYSSLLTSQPTLHSQLENALYAHHNMGMVMASSMDLMAITTLKEKELGQIREVFLMGQRMGRIFNVLATSEREMAEGDVSSEIPPSANKSEMESAQGALRKELRMLSLRIDQKKKSISSFSVKKYLKGLKQVGRLHETMKGLI